jgi:hypothetical protein
MPAAAPPAATRRIIRNGRKRFMRFHQLADAAILQIETRQQLHASRDD